MTDRETTGEAEARAPGNPVYGITGTPSGDIWFVSLTGSYLANVDLGAARRRSMSLRTRFSILAR